jgi:hypothetical protein
MQKPAVTAVDVGEHSDHIIGLQRRLWREFDVVAFAQRLERGTAIVAAALFGDLLAGFDVHQIAFKQVTPIGRNIAELMVVADFVQSRDRRW